MDKQANPLLEAFGAYTKRYQERTTSFRTPEEVLATLASGPTKMDLVPYEFQCTVAHLLIEKLGRDVSTRPEALIGALKEALGG